MNRIFLSGVACVGKTSVGSRLAALLGCRFFDLDAEIETFFGTSIERLKVRFPFPRSFREEASKVLAHLLSKPESHRCVVALPPSGLMEGYWQVVKSAEAITVVLQDTPENILDRIVFFDVDSRPLKRTLTDTEKRLYLREIRKDVTYFKRSYRRAAVIVDIAGLGPEDAVLKLCDSLSTSHLELGVASRCSQ